MWRGSGRSLFELRRVLLAGLVLSAAACACGGSEGRRPSGDDDDAGAAGVSPGGSSNGGSSGKGGRGGGAGKGGSGGSGATGGSGDTGGSGAEGGEGEDPCVACSDQHRECDVDSGTCGDCFSDYREVGGTCVCPEGQIPEGNQCVACADDFAPNCVGAGETGRVVRKVDGACICETTEGYFFNLESNTAQACDGDADGWVNDGAQPALDGNDEVLRENARCDLRSVAAIVLENEAGDQLALNLLDDFPGGLPLYESARNDGVESATPHQPYGNEALAPAVLNSLTKACVSANGDYDDNGIPDLNEWSGRTLAGRVTRNPRLQGYYQRYLRFTYYLELHDGWYEAEGDGRYVVRERGRVAGEIPVRYPSGSNQYFRECARRIDVDYKSGAMSFAGGDFVQIGGTAADMTHHSQFKCVQVMSENDYGSAYSREKNPEIVYKPIQTGFARRATSGMLHQCPADVLVTSPVPELYDWTPNVCSARATTTPISNDLAVNPSAAELECEAVDAASIEPGVYWMAVGYENFACDRSDAVTETAAGYTRGCVNACAEQGVSVCPSYDPGSPAGSTRFTCDDEGRTAFGRLQCGCGQAYGGATCEIGCPASDVLMTPDFSIETRDGYWMCGGPKASSVPLLTGGNFSLRGYVRQSSGAASALSGGPFVLRAR